MTKDVNLVWLLFIKIYWKNIALKVDLHQTLQLQERLPSMWQNFTLHVTEIWNKSMDK